MFCPCPFLVHQAYWIELAGGFADEQDNPAVPDLDARDWTPASLAAFNAGPEIALAEVQPIAPCLSGKA